MTASLRLTGPLAVVALVLAACGPATLVHFDGEGISFDYPGSWRAASFDVVSTFSSLIVYLSTEPLSDPCDRKPMSIACTREPVVHLGPNGILADWWRRGSPGWAFDPTKGQPITVAGRTATIEQLDPDEGCQNVGGDRKLVLTIPDPTPNWNWTELDACLRGPALDALQAQVEAMLSTVHWKD